MKVGSEEQQLGLYRLLNMRLANNMCKGCDEPVIKCNLLEEDHMVTLR